MSPSTLNNIYGSERRRVKMDYIQNLNTDIEKVIRGAEAEIKKVVKAAVVQSFKNGIEVGKGRKAGANTDGKVTAGERSKPRA
jgi:hypothetical protein